MARLEVTDIGSGIPDEFRPHIFGKFAQADSSDTRRYEGTGLGLNIAKQLIELMGGNIGFETEVNKGTTFFFNLPIAEQDYVFLAENSCYRLLLVEDDETIIVFLQALLEQKGFMLDVVHNIPEARKMLGNHYYSAMILDLILPLGNGLEFLREIRQRLATSDLPVIVVSAKAEEAHQRTDESLKVTKWLQKPIDAAKLLDTLQQIMSNDGTTLPQILHLEGDQDLTRVLAGALQGQAMIVSATTLAIAKHHLKSQQFDLILLDWMVADGQPNELLEMIKDIPIIALSASEPPPEIKNRVLASLEKSRVSEAEILNKILSLLPYKGVERRRST